MNSRTHWNASDYASHSSAQEQWAKELIHKLNLQGDEVGLDIGCGDGRITAQMAAMLVRGEMIGIDLSDSMIAFANEHYGGGNLAFHQMSATMISLPSQYDFAFSNAALHWVKDHFKVLTGVRGVLKSGGRILFQMGGRGNVEDIRSAFSVIMAQPRWQHHFDGFEFPYYFYGPEEYADWLPGSGFNAERVELIGKTMVHESRDGLKGWLRTTWFPYLNRVDPEKRDELLNEVLDEYLDHHPLDANGQTRVEMVRLEVEATAV